MDDDRFERALAMLAAGKRWQQAGVEHRQGEYVCSGEEVWRDGADFVHRSWSAHGWGGGLPDDVHEHLERWGEAALRERLHGALCAYDWESAPSGAPSVPSAFDPLRPMPGAIASTSAVTDTDLDRVIGHLRRGYTYDRSGTEVRDATPIWGREQLRHPPPAESELFYRTRSWARGQGDEVCVRSDRWDEAALREVLRARPDVVHWERWPKA